MLKTSRIIHHEITLGGKNRPILLPSEKILLRTRQHWIVLLLPLTATFLIGVFLAYSFIQFSLLFFHNIFPAISAAILILAICSSAAAKMLLDWLGHFYILTTSRILEVCYKPLFSNYINNVILNQVKSTEIDVEGNGLINQLFNIGNVMVTFDRPTHREEFCLINIKDPKSVGFLFTEVLDSDKPDTIINPLWYKTKNQEHPFRFTQEIFPGGSWGIT